MRNPSGTLQINDKFLEGLTERDERIYRLLKCFNGGKQVTQEDIHQLNEKLVDKVDNLTSLLLTVIPLFSDTEWKYLALAHNEMALAFVCALKDCSHSWGFRSLVRRTHDMKGWYWYYSRLHQMFTSSVS
jgi:hypothetical protein